jgi:hypothetical protein
MTRLQEGDCSGSDWKRAVREALRPQAHPSTIVVNPRRG